MATRHTLSGRLRWRPRRHGRMPAGRPPLPPEERRVRIGLLVKPDARARLRQLAEDKGISQNRVVEELIMREKHSGNGESR